MVRHALALLLAACLAPLAAADVPALAALKERLGAAVDASPALSDKAKAYVKEKLLPQVGDAAWAAACAAQNAKKVPLAEIQKLDKEWQDADQELPLQKACLENACAQALKGFLKDQPAIKECFVMDDQGANVAQNALTSDYWQGDEDKWKNSFAGGKGGLDVGKAKFDKSANANLQQVSLPVADAAGTVVGAVCFGLAIDSL